LHVHDYFILQFTTVVPGINGHQQLVSPESHPQTEVCLFMIVIHVCEHMSEPRNANEYDSLATENNNALPRSSLLVVAFVVIVLVTRVHYFSVL
jgi:hypothetical protein